MAAGSKRGSAIQAMSPMAIAATASMSERIKSGIEDQNWTCETKKTISRDRPEISRIIGTCEFGKEEKLSGRHDPADVRCERPALAIGRANKGMREAEAVDGDRSVDEDILTGDGNDGLDQRREPTRTEASTEIAPLVGELECCDRWRADEDAIADSDRTR